jgi:FixJ family two-component response regulator
LVSDVMMPGLSGLELAGRLQRSRPRIKVLLMSGYMGDVVAQAGALDPSTPFLQKPFNARTLALKVREVLDATAAGGLPEDFGDGSELPAANDRGLRYPA